MSKILFLCLIENPKHRNNRVISHSAIFIELLTISVPSLCLNISNHYYNKVKLYPYL